MPTNVTSTSESIIIYDSYDNKFALDNLTISLSCKLAAAAFIGSRTEVGQIRNHMTDDTIYNSGNIILEDNSQSSIISVSEKPDHISEIRLLDRLISTLSVISNILFGNKPGK